MIFFKVFFIGLFIVVIGGFTYFAIADIPVHQTDKVETIPASAFQN